MRQFGKNQDCVGGEKRPQRSPGDKKSDRNQHVCHVKHSRPQDMRISPRVNERTGNEFPFYRDHLRRLGEWAFVRPSILQALALRALNDLGGARRIVHAQLCAV
jgi:hypothetical protein